MKKLVGGYIQSNIRQSNNLPKQKSLYDAKRYIINKPVEISDDYNQGYIISDDEKTEQQKFFASKCMNCQSEGMIFDTFYNVSCDYDFKDFKKRFRDAFRDANGKDEVSGIYLIFNITQNKWYVGQGQKAFKRCMEHFRERQTTKDNVPLVREDWLNGDAMYVNFIKLNGNQFGFDTLDELEYHYIDAYDCIEPKGYNHKSGNKTNR